MKKSYRQEEWYWQDLGVEALDLGVEWEPLWLDGLDGKRISDETKPCDASWPDFRDEYTCEAFCRSQRDKYGMQPQFGRTVGYGGCEYVSTYDVATWLERHVFVDGGIVVSVGETEPGMWVNLMAFDAKNKA